MRQEYEVDVIETLESTFGETITAVELTPEGTGYRAKTVSYTHLDVYKRQE